MDRRATKREPRNLEEWKRLQKLENHQRVFTVIGGYPDLRRTLLARGWVANDVPESPYFDLKWTLKAEDIRQTELKSHQIVNHFVGNREITTKVGLTTNLKESFWRCDVHSEEYYPQAFCVSDTGERDDFIAEFKLTQAQAVLKRFLAHVAGPAHSAELTFGESVLYAALGVCDRLCAELDEDILDEPTKAASFMNVTAQEWAILGAVDLERPGAVVDVPTVPAPAPPSELRDRREIARDEADAALSAKPRKKKKKKKKKQVEEEEDPIEMTTCLKQYRETPRGKFMVGRVERCVEVLGTQLQAPIIGCQNAWIIKPAGKSRGRGVQMVKSVEQILKLTETEESQWVCQKYIENPMLIAGYKFDIRQWVLVTDLNPLTIWIWKQPYIRFAAVKYDDSLADDTKFMHLVNNSIVKEHPTFSEHNSELQTRGLMWFRQDFEAWLHRKYNKDWRGCDCSHLKKPPPYTCATYGIDFHALKDEDKAFQEGDDDDGDAEPDEEAVPEAKATAANEALESDANFSKEAQGRPAAKAEAQE